MERDEREREWDQPAQDIPVRSAEFWDIQLQRLKRRAEGLANGTNTSPTSDGKFRLEPGCCNGH